MKVWIFKNWPLLFLMACLLLIGFTFNNSANANTIGNQVTDSAITLKIKAKYLNDALLNPFDIKVTTTQGTVRLAGSVDTAIQYEQAVILAENTDGVLNVNVAHLVIKSSPTPSNDLVITAKIKGLYLKNSIFANENSPETWAIHVETADGHVYLAGSVKNSAERDKAINLAKSVKGVKAVKANLKYNQQ